MIDVKVRENGILMNGHAGHHINGQDLVCSAVSAITCTLIHALEDLSGNRIRADTGSGFTRIEWDELSEKGKLLVDSWFLGIVDINTEYNCIRFV